MEWILRSLQDISAFQDEFLLDRFRVRLQGSRLTVDAEQEGENEPLSTSIEVATRYVAALRKHGPGLVFTQMTLRELASLPAEAITIHGRSAAEHKRLNETMRRARRDVLVSANPDLSQCYDYLQDAREADDDSYLFQLYKFVETLGHAFSGEAEMIKALKVKTPVKSLKQLTNAPLRDARHARKVGDVVQRPSTEERTVAMDYCYQILHAYERYLCSST